MAGDITSAVNAMNALRAQIEDRLFQTEDYRALKAIEKAIADVLSPSTAKFNNLSAILNSLANSHPQNGVAQQKLA